MSRTPVESESWHELVAATVVGPDFLRATFGGPVRGEGLSAWKRVVIRPIELRGRRHLQFSYFDAKKDVTKNFRGSDVGPRLGEVLRAGFAAVHLATRTEEIDIRTTRKGKVHIGRRKAPSDAAPELPPHNRVKDLPLPEGRADRLLEVMGVLTRDGSVRPSMRAKFTQINEFLKHLAHLLDAAGLRTLGRTVKILDCGCGSSYLTLATHHYLNDVLGIPAHILGVDINEEVIRKSVQRSERLNAEHVAFRCGPIGAVEARPDIVLALHACDTATDDALALAIRSEARLVMSVPCCHRHLNDRIRPQGPAEVLRPLLRHGILQQRTADQVTDAFRALILRIMGYRTDVVEFVTPEHTARNLMIRAVRGAPVGEAGLVREYHELCRFWGATPFLARVVGEPLLDSSFRETMNHPAAPPAQPGP